MPNTQAKERKRRRVRINAELKSNGRTKQQIRNKKMKDDLANYEKNNNTVIEPAGAALYIRYELMREEIARVARVEKIKAEAQAEAQRRKGE